ncbi:MAG: Glu/Leu/Phe/Val dehydrogenase [archaeon]|nr:Glu/Leu/Phe/Val dehydrogenase [archaeon]
MIEYDDFGPEKVFEVYHPRLGMKGFVVIDNTALGPGKGGIRMTPTVSVEEVYKLARSMTWKTALAELPFGGAKAGIIADPRQISLEKKYELMKAFSLALKPVCPSLYVSAPDINTAEKEMEIFAKTNGSKKACTGKPKSMGGLPHELGSTGFGVFHATKVGADYLKMDLNGATFAVEGFGNVGFFAAKFLTEAGAKMVGTSDIDGGIYNPKGLNFKQLEELSNQKKSVINYADAKKINHAELFELPVDILVTAAMPNVIGAHNVNNVKAKLVVEGSNIPMTGATEKTLHERKVLVIPDIIANAGGVISSYEEYIGGNEKTMFKHVEKTITSNVKLILDSITKKDRYPRTWAMDIARERVLAKCEDCRI